MAFGDQECSWTRDQNLTLSHTITWRVAYWVGGIDPWDRGEPTAIPIRSLSDPKAACLQATNDRVAHDNYPTTAPVDPQAIKPLRGGAPAIIKPYLIAKRDEIEQNIEHNTQEGEDSQLCLWPIPTWAELLHSVVNHGQELGWDKPTLTGQSRAEADSSGK